MTPILRDSEIAVANRFMVEHLGRVNQNAKNPTCDGHEHIHSHQLSTKGNMLDSLREEPPQDHARDIHNEQIILVCLNHKLVVGYTHG
jgi:hypothetical protein